MSKSTLIIFLIVLFCQVKGFSQKSEFQSLERFFAGIPLNDKYAKWVEYLYTTPSLGIDSVGSRGMYSSIKNNLQPHFPFPDSAKIKILLYTALLRNRTKQYDTIKTAYIEALFGNDRESQKDALNCFNDIKTVLKQYYTDIIDSDFQMFFAKGKNGNFPPVLLERAYLQDQKSFYVLLMCQMQQ